MQEGPVDVYLRHRSELLKAIYDGGDASQEVGDFLISTMNLENHGIDYKLTSEDRLCINFSSDLLKEEDAPPEKNWSTAMPHDFLNWRPASYIGEPTPHPWRGRVKMAWGKGDNERFNYPLYSPKREGETHREYKERNKIPSSMKHGLWPEVLSSRTRPVRKPTINQDGRRTTVEAGVETEPVNNYTDVSPFDERVHPLRRIRADTGKPEWENILRDLYLGDNKWAEKIADAEKHHKRYWKKNDDGMGEFDSYNIYDTSVNDLYPFFGGNDGHGSESVEHLHGLRLRDFERWKNGTSDWGGFNGENTEKHKERIKALEKDGKNLEEEHFNDRMEKLLSDDISPVTYEHRRNDDNPYENWNNEGLEALKDLTKIHAHGMGHPTWMRGMEFLSPEERTLVMEHCISDGGTDHPSNQYIELDDGHRLSMARIKQTKKQRQEGELHWFQRGKLHSGPNVPSNLETPHDTFIHGDEGLVKNALDNILIKEDGPYQGPKYAQINRTDEDGNTIYGSDGKPVTKSQKMYDMTARQHLIEKLEEAYEGDNLLEYGDEEIHHQTGLPIGKKKSLPLFHGEHFDDITHAMSSHGDAKKALDGKISSNSDIAMSVNSFMDLVGWNSDLTERHENHPLFPERGGKGIITKEIMGAILKEIKDQSGLSLSAKDIRNSLNSQIAGHGPKREDLSEEQLKHYLEIDGKLKGLGHVQGGSVFAHRGGLGRQLTTYGEIMHDFLGDEINWNDGEAYTSEVGERGETGSRGISPRRDTMGLWGRSHPHILPHGQKYHTDAHGIMAMTDTNAAGQSGRGRNVKTNNFQYLSTRSPYFMARFMSENPDPNIYEMKTRNLTARDLAHHGFQSHNFATSTNFSMDAKKPADWTDEQWDRRITSGDYTIRRMAALARMQAHANGRLDGFDSPRQRLHTSLADIENDPSLMSSSNMEHSDYLSEMPWYKDTNLKDDLGPEFFDDLQRVQNIMDRLKMVGGEFPSDSPIMRRYDNLMAHFDSKYASQITDNKKGWGHRDSMEDAMKNDKIAVIDFAREHIMPKVLEAHPNAFNPENPKALINLSAILQDAQRAIYKVGGRGINTSAAWIRPTTIDTTSDEHYTMANMMKAGEVGSRIEEGENISSILDKLDFPDDPAHRKHVEHMMSKHGGNIVAASLGQLATAGIPWNPNEKEDSVFHRLGDEADIHDHMIRSLKELKDRMSGGSRAKGEENTAYKTEKARVTADWRRTHDSYNAMSYLRNLMRKPRDALRAYGITYQASPIPGKNPLKARKTVDGEPLGNRELLFPWKEKKGDRRDLNHHRSIANSMVIFDEGALEGGELTAENAPKQKEEVGWMNNVPIMPHDSGEGATVHDHYLSGGMDDGYLFTPEIGAETDENNQIVVGQNSSERYLHSLPWEVMSRLLPNYTSDHLQTMVQNHAPGEMSASNQQLPDNAGYSPSDRFTSVSTGEEMEIDGLLLKEKDAKLPKRVPLIEPMHRIFDIDDLQQLRGFTGEWVVSIHKDGKRCKAQCKSNRITLIDEDGNKQSMSDEMRGAFKKIGKKDYVVDGTLSEGEFFVNDILLYDGDVVYDLTTRERIKVLRGQFDSFDPVHIPSPSDIRITDEVGLKAAVKDLAKESDKILLRDAKSTYMKGEEKHPKWVLLAKSDIDYHIPFSMEIDGASFVIHLPEDLVKYDLVDGEAVNPIAAIGSITNSDYSLNLAKSLEVYWRDSLTEMLKEETEIEPEIDEERIEEESAGIIKPKKDKNLIMKPNDVYKTLLLIERAMDAMEKGFSNLAGRGFGYDVGDGSESPRGPTSLNSEESLPDWDMRKRPKEDMEKPEDYPGRRSKARENAEQSNELAERSLEG